MAWNWRMDFGCNLKQVERVDYRVQAVVGRRHYPGWTAGLRGACSPALPPSQAGALGCPAYGGGRDAL